MTKYLPHSYYADLGDALRVATPPCGIGYRAGHGWFFYDLLNGCPDYGTPDFLFVARGRLPIPLTEYASESLQSLVKTKLGEYR